MRLSLGKLLNRWASEDFWYHSQCLDKGKKMWRSGRCWLHTSHGKLGCEWKVWKARYHIAFSTAHYDENYHFSFGCGLFAIYLNWECKPWKASQDKEWRIAFHNGAVWVNWGLPADEWKSTYPKWRHWNFNPTDWLLGDFKHSKKDLETHKVLIPMPEKAYPATITLFESTWGRKRWPWVKKMVRANIDIEEQGGIPFPGKGENSWDCGMDGLGSLTTHAETVHDAVAATVASVYQSRKRYAGSWDWVPENVAGG
jgi:hypothetical protein